MIARAVARLGLPTASAGSLGTDNFSDELWDASVAAGLDMQPAHVLIFGHAKAGTPLMVASPLLALDLPLKVLVWEDAEKKVWASYNTPEFLIQRHSLPADLAKNISGVEGLIKGALGIH